jgi:hypothetical protein
VVVAQVLGRTTVTTTRHPAWWVLLSFPQRTAGYREVVQIRPALRGPPLTVTAAQSPTVRQSPARSDPADHTAEYRITRVEHENLVAELGPDFGHQLGQQT